MPKSICSCGEFCEAAEVLCPDCLTLEAEDIAEGDLCTCGNMRLVDSERCFECLGEETEEE